MNDGFERVTAWLAAQNHPHAPMALPVAARTAREAADGLGVALGQIAKSVIFRRLADDVAVLVVASGDRRVDELMDELELRPRRDQLTGTLSGGWKQRVSLACATAHHPRMLFLDEPTAGVDPAARRRFWQMIHEMAKGGTTILVTTHYMDEAERCERIAFLSRGHLIAVGTVDEITAQFRQPSIEDVFIELQRRDEGAVV